MCEVGEGEEGGEMPKYAPTAHCQGVWFGVGLGLTTCKLFKLMTLGVAS